jgi:hypothetical protein
LPLKAIVKYGLAQKIKNYMNIKEFNLDGVVTLISEVGLTNWKMNTKTELKSFDWNESPTMTVFGKMSLSPI